MKNLFLLTICILYYGVSSAQIIATTTGGKKVILNVKDYTWKYADNKDSEQPCIKKHQGKVKFINNTTNDLYFFYQSSHSLYITVEFFKVLAGSSKIVDDLYSLWGNDYEYGISYSWKAALEVPVDFQSNRPINRVKGTISSGTFSIIDCETQQVSVE